LKVGSRLAVTGRIQSRQYMKTLPDGQAEERTAYEVSVSKLEVVPDEE
jgi:single-stranded DNA-binding protein